MAPAASRNGTMGKGGGRRAGIAIAPNPQRSNLWETFAAVLSRELALHCLFAAFPGQTVSDVAADDRTDRRH